MKLSDYLKDYTLKSLPVFLFGGLGYIATKILLEASDPFFETVVPSVSKQSMTWTILLLFLLNVVLIAWLVSIVFGDKVAKIKKSHKHLPYRGFYVHNVTGQKICSNCIEKGIVAPLGLFIDDKGEWWECPISDCRKQFDMLNDERNT